MLLLEPQSVQYLTINLKQNVNLSFQVSNFVKTFKYNDDHIKSVVS
jgi:hypothetical protein